MDGPREAEKYRDEDEANKPKIEAKNGLENYCFTVRNTLTDEKIKEKFESGDKEKKEAALRDGAHWLDKNQLAETDKFRGGGLSVALMCHFLCNGMCAVKGPKLLCLTVKFAQPKAGPVCQRFFRHNRCQVSTNCCTSSFSSVSC